MNDSFKKGSQAQDFLFFAPLDAENNTAPNWKRFLVVETALEWRPNLPAYFGGELECHLSLPVLRFLTYEL